jgi:hypothetical protein
MSSPYITPNMFLTEPAVGSTLSPSWALLLNTDLGIIDQHNHTPGYGVQIPPSGLNINADLTFQDHNLLDLSSLVFGTEPGSPANLSLYSNGTDLFYVDSTGHAIQLTLNHQPNTSTGNIQGLPSSPVGDAGISWVNAQSTFQFLQDSGSVGANIDVGTLVLRYPGSYPTPSGHYIALEAPSSLATGYAFTFPSTLPPINNSFLSSSTAGTLSYIQADGTILEVSGGILQIANGSIPNSKLAATPYAPTMPQVTRYTSGSGTYSVPAGTLYLEVTVTGAGGGGAGANGSGANPGGSNGGLTRFYSGVWELDGNPGNGAPTTSGSASGAGAGGSFALSGTGYTLLFAVSGGSGGSALLGTPSGSGGNGYYGGAGGGSDDMNGNSGVAPGAGGAGAYYTGNSYAFPGGGGGAGGTASAIITNLSGTITYSVGSGGAGGVGNQYTGGNGANGLIIIVAHFQ